MKVLPMSWLSPQLAFHLLPRQACAMGRRTWETISVRVCWAYVYVMTTGEVGLG